MIMKSILVLNLLPNNQIDSKLIKKEAILSAPLQAPKIPGPEALGQPLPSHATTCRSDSPPLCSCTPEIGVARSSVHQRAAIVLLNVAGPTYLTPEQARRKPQLSAPVCGGRGHRARRSTSYSQETVGSVQTCEVDLCKKLHSLEALALRTRPCF